MPSITYALRAYCAQFRTGMSNEASHLPPSEHPVTNPSEADEALPRIWEHR